MTGKQLKQLREARGWSRSETARRADISPAAVERHEHLPHLANINQRVVAGYAAAYEVSAAEIRRVPAGVKVQDGRGKYERKRKARKGGQR